MKYCSKCGQQVHDEAVICPYCGCAISGSTAVTNDAPSTGFAVLGFLIPIVGLILYLVNKDTAPQKARSAGRGALIGFIVGIVFSVIYGVVVGSMIGSMYYY